MILPGLEIQALRSSQSKHQRFSSPLSRIRSFREISRSFFLSDFFQVTSHRFQVPPSLNTIKRMCPATQSQIGRSVPYSEVASALKAWTCKIRNFILLKPLRSRALDCFQVELLAQFRCSFLPFPDFWVMKIRSAFEKIFAGEWKKGEIPPLWDGLASSRIAGEIEKYLLNNAWTVSDRWKNILAGRSCIGILSGSSS